MAQPTQVIQRLTHVADPGAMRTRCGVKRFTPASYPLVHPGHVATHAGRPRDPVLMCPDCLATLEDVCRG